MIIPSQPLHERQIWRHKRCQVCSTDTNKTRPQRCHRRATALTTTFLCCGGALFIRCIDWTRANDDSIVNFAVDPPNPSLVETAQKPFSRERERERERDRETMDHGLSHDYDHDHSQRVICM
mmetsp:Transcript_4740/g.12431  ORF Transcript_4740/g.12431 Transcript_4740/m.12431 type:complete len:122 (+) Transcript_4740:760-1125(+)